MLDHCSEFFFPFVLKVPDFNGLLEIVGVLIAKVLLAFLT